MNTLKAIAICKDLEIIETASREVKVNALNLLELKNRKINYEWTNQNKALQCQEQIEILEKRIVKKGKMEITRFMMNVYCNVYGDNYEFSQLLSLI